jgi:hypothetical protein
MSHGTEFKITFKELEYEERLWTLDIYHLIWN